LVTIRNQKPSLGREQLQQMRVTPHNSIL
jgi:hypothetical protein